MMSLTNCWGERLRDEHKTRRDDQRSPFQRDKARILHSAAFRRLQAKTQVLGTGMNDFYRTRLTHSLEAAQIGQGIVAQLRIKYPQHQDILPSDQLIEALCLAHDIGHPPYGHGGETALNYMMRDHGGFEGNAQTFRIVSRLEPYTEHDGMNLSRRTLLGLIKYPALLSQCRSPVQPPVVSSLRQLPADKWHPAKGIYDDDQQVFDWVLAPFTTQDRTLLGTMRQQRDDNGHLKTRYKSIDCAIMELADDIAYGVHDMEDAVVLGILSRERWRSAFIEALPALETPWAQNLINTVDKNLFSGAHHQRKDAIGALVNALVTSVQLQPQQCFEHPLLEFSVEFTRDMQIILEQLKAVVYRYVIRKPELQHIVYKGQQLVMELFEAFSADANRLLPENTANRWRLADDAHKHRVIADYIAGMTDVHAARLHGTLFSSRPSTLDYGFSD